MKSSPFRPPLRGLLLLLAGALVGGLAGCASLWPERQLRAGQSEAEVVALMAPLTGRHALPAGGTRLEFARGPYGRVTWMADLDAAGRLQRWQQVLDERHFAHVVDGMSRDELLRLLGRPGDRAGEWQHRETWSWRYENNDCLWFRVTLTAEGRVRDGGSLMSDPHCDVRDAAR